MDRCADYFTNEDYIDLLYRRSDEPDPEAAGYRDFCVSVIDDRWGIIHISRDELGDINYENFGYTSFPIVYGTQDYGAMGAAGITQVREQPFLMLRGTGTLIGIVDTGIKYDHEAFVREDGSSTIEAVWDQTAENAGGDGNASGEENSEAESRGNINREMELDGLVPYGRVYSNAQLNEALASDNPRSIVPVTDEAGGHGTMLAGLAAGQERPEKGFTGAAPGA